MDSESRCSNCNSQYVLEADSRKKQTGVKLPLLLKCGHCYCSQCLHGIAKQLQFTAVPCPECRVPTPLLPNVKLRAQLPLSYYTVGVVRAGQLSLQRSLFFGEGDDETSGEDELEARSKMLQEENAACCLECEECETRPAEVKCNKCDCVYCKACFEVVHSSSKTLRQHKQVSLTEEGTTGSYTDDEVQPKMKLLDNAVSRGKAHVVALKRTATVLTANESKVLDSGDRSLENCRSEVCQLHHQLEASLASIELDYMNNRKTIIREYKTLREELRRQEKLLGGFLEKARLLTSNKKLLIQNSDSVISEIEEVMDRLPKLQESYSKGRSLRVTSNCKNIDLTSLFTLESNEDQQLPLVLETDHTLSPNKTHPHAATKTHPHAVTRPETSPVKSNILSPRISGGSAVSNKTPSSRGSSRISSRGVSRETSPFVDQGRVTGEELESAIACKVTHVETPNEFWVQFEEEISKLETLEKFIRKYCSDSKQEPFLEKGTVCAGLTRDGAWCRGLIEKVVWENPRYAVVLLIDYGQVEMINIGNLCGIPDKWSGFPFLAHKCSLGGVQPMSKNVAVAPKDWTQNAISFFRSVTVKQNNIKLKVLSRGWSQESMCELLLVDLFLPAAKNGGVSVSRMLIQQGKAQRVKESTPLQPKDLPIGPVPPAGAKIEVDMITAQSPTDFYVVPANSNDHVADLISAHISSHPLFLSPSSLVPGSLVIAPFDGGHYRAKILECDGEGSHVTVRFLDYGNTSSVDGSGLYELTKKLCKIPPECYHCQLTEAAGRVWPEDVCEKFYEMTNGKRLLMMVEGSMVDNMLPVKILYYENGQNVWSLVNPQPTVEQPSPSATPPPVVLPPIGFEGQVIIKHVQTPCLFHVVLCSNLDSFELVESCNQMAFPSPFVPKAGEYCHALFPSDQKYHRGVVRSCSDDSTYCDVYYIDYGNTESVAIGSLLPLPNELCREPALAIPCKLFGVDEGYQFDYQKSIKFYQQVFEKEATILVKDVQKDTPLVVVSMFCDLPEGQDIDILSTLDVGVALSSDDTSSFSHPMTPTSSGTCNSSQTPPPVTTPPTALSAGRSPRSNQSVNSPLRGSTELLQPISSASFKYVSAVRPEGAEFKIVVTYVDQNSTIFGQPIAYSEQFSEIDESVSRIVSSCRPVSSLSSLSLQQGCVARYREDGQWYRAVITDISVDKITAEAYFVDFGNVGVVQSHDVITQLATPHLSELALSFTEYSSIGQDKLSCLIDKELTVKPSSKGMCKLYFEGVELQQSLYRMLPLPPSSPSSIYSSS